jgi:hypothetical protein
LDRDRSFLPIKWRETTLHGQVFSHAVISLLATLDSVDCLVQLDTGANGIFMSDNSVSSSGKMVQVELQVGMLRRSVTMDAASIAYLREHPFSRAGSIGNAFFEQGTIELDFASNQFRYVPGGLLNDNPAAIPFYYAKQTNWDGGHVLIEIGLPDLSRKKVLLDTGAAMFTFVPADRALWEKLLNENSIQHAEMSAEIQGADGKVSCDFQTMNSPLNIEKYPVAAGLYAYSGSHALVNIPGHPQGTVGMQTFINGKITLDYVSSLWMYSAQ